MKASFFRLTWIMAAAAWLTPPAGAADAGPLRERLKESPFKIAYESYVDGNWDIFVMNADGSHPVNLTQTPGLNEHYPHISPDGRQMCFAADKGEGRDAIRSLYVMDADGQNRKKIADYAREPFWSPDGKVIGFLDQEYEKFNVMDFYTKGMNFYELATGKIVPHPNYTNLHHLYNPGFCANGKWIVATVHAGMGYDHTILLIEAHGNRIIDLRIPGCRPSFSADGKHLAWGSGDNEIALGTIDTDSDKPKMGPWQVRIKDALNKIYHVRWSPDGQFLSFSRGPDGEGDPNKPGTFQAACEIMGVYAPGWNICAVPAEGAGTIDLAQAKETDFTTLTTNGLSNKESAWFQSASKASLYKQAQGGPVTPVDAAPAKLPATPCKVTTASGVEMVFLPGGEFMMGTSQGTSDEGPAHRVRLSSFMMDKYPVTHEMFRKAQLPDPSHWQDNPKGPVEQVRWRDAKQYCNERSLLEGLKRCYDEKTPDWSCDYSANGYRLPTEAEWEYACRARMDGPYDFGSPDKLRQYAWFADNANRRTHPVGQKKPNLWGLYGMYGNVSEWCEDVYSPTYYRESAPVDLRGPASPGKDVMRVLRGGSWNASPSMCRATFRQGQRTGDTDACFCTDFCGFRCVRRVSPAELQSLRANLN